MVGSGHCHRLDMARLGYACNNMGGTLGPLFCQGWACFPASCPGHPACCPPHACLHSPVAFFSLMQVYWLPWDKERDPAELLYETTQRLLAQASEAQRLGAGAAQLFERGLHPRVPLLYWHALLTGRPGGRGQGRGSEQAGVQSRCMVRFHMRARRALGGGPCSVLPYSPRTSHTASVALHLLRRALYPAMPAVLSPWPHLAHAEYASLLRFQPTRHPDAVPIEQVGGACKGRRASGCQHGRHRKVSKG